MPLEITWNKKIVEIKEERKKIIDWSDKSIKRFRENLKKEGIESPRNWKELKELIRKALPRRKILEGKKKKDGMMENIEGKKEK